MPTYKAHLEFCKNNYYDKWILISLGRKKIGAGYWYTDLFCHKYLGMHFLPGYYSKEVTVMRLICEEFPTFHMNISPHNRQIIEMLLELGFTKIQENYQWK